MLQHKTESIMGEAVSMVLKCGPVSCDVYMSLQMPSGPCMKVHIKGIGIMVQLTINVAQP